MQDKHCSVYVELGSPASKEFETFSRKELDRLKDDPRRKVLPEEVLLGRLSCE